MKIIELKSENVKKVKAIEIKPKGNMVMISGKNGAGKTSVLDSIWFALEGKSSLKGTPMPIRKGEKNAEVKMTLDDFVVVRKWTDNDKSYLKVTNREGMTFSSPQELLDSFIGKLTFDPLEFAQMTEREQRNLLLMVAGIDIDHWDSWLVSLREERRVQGQKVKLYGGEREEIAIGNLPKEKISLGELNSKLEKAINYNNRIANTEHALDLDLREIDNLKAKIKSLEEDIKAEQEFLKNNKRIETDNIRDDISQAEKINEQITIRERNKEADKKQAEAQNVYDKFTKKIEEVMKEKETALKTAEMPIPGLSVNDTGVTYNDIPFGQLSSSEQLKVSLGIAMALNPKLKVIRITDGSLLDDDSMAIIRKLAEKKDYQVWCEKVDGTGKIGFYIEEGEVKNEN